MLRSSAGTSLQRVAGAAWRAGVRGLQGREACLMSSSEIAAQMEHSFLLHPCLSNPKAYPPSPFSNSSPITLSPAASLVSRPGAGARRPRSQADCPQKAGTRNRGSAAAGHDDVPARIRDCGEPRPVPECAVPHHRPLTWAAASPRLAWASGMFAGEKKKVGNECCSQSASVCAPSAARDARG